MLRLERLCSDLQAAKREEREATGRRIAVEQSIIGEVGLPAEGAKTVDCEGWKIHVEQKINRKIDEKKWTLIKDQIPEQLRPVHIVEEYKIENQGVAWLKENELGFYKLLCTAMEEKAVKPSVKVEEI